MAWPSVDENSNQESSQTANSVPNLPEKSDNTKIDDATVLVIRNVTFSDVEYYKHSVDGQTYIAPRQSKIENKVQKTAQTARKSFSSHTSQHQLISKLHLKKLNQTEWSFAGDRNLIAREEYTSIPGPSKAGCSKEKPEKAMKRKDKKIKENGCSFADDISSIAREEDMSIPGPSKAGCSKEKPEKAMKRKDKKIKENGCSFADDISSIAREEDMSIPGPSKAGCSKEKPEKAMKRKDKKIKENGWSFADDISSIAREEDMSIPGPSKAGCSKEKPEKAMKRKDKKIKENGWSFADDISSIAREEDTSIPGPSKAGCSKEKPEKAMKSFPKTGNQKNWESTKDQLKKVRKTMSVQKENSKSPAFSQRNVPKPSPSSTKGENIEEVNLNYSYEDHFKKNVYKQSTNSKAVDICPKLSHKKKVEPLSSTEDELEECEMLSTKSVHRHSSYKSNVNIKKSNSQKRSCKKKVIPLPSTDDESEECEMLSTKPVHRHLSYKSNLNTKGSHSQKLSYKRKLTDDESEESNSATKSKVEYKMTAKKSVSKPPRKKFNGDICQKSHKSYEDKAKKWETLKKKKRVRKLESTDDELEDEYLTERENLNYNNTFIKKENNSTEEYKNNTMTSDDDEIIFLMEKKFHGHKDRLCCVCQEARALYYCSSCTRKYCASNQCTGDHSRLCQLGYLVPL